MQRFKLIKGKGRKKQYEVMGISTCDDFYHEFNMEEWDFRETTDWLDVFRYDKTEFMSFLISSIVWIKFKQKEVKSINNGDLKPVV